MTAVQVLANVALLDPDQQALIGRWIERGDGIAVYENLDLGHRDLGRRQFVSYGSSAAQLETDEADMPYDEPPPYLPDIGGLIGWRYKLVGKWRPGVREEAMVV